MMEQQYKEAVDNGEPMVASQNNLSETISIKRSKQTREKILCSQPSRIPWRKEKCMAIA